MPKTAILHQFLGCFLLFFAQKQLIFAQKTPKIDSKINKKHQKIHAFYPFLFRCETVNVEFTHPVSLRLPPLYRKR